MSCAAWIRPASGILLREKALGRDDVHVNTPTCGEGWLPVRVKAWWREHPAQAVPINGVE